MSRNRSRRGAYRPVGQEQRRPPVVEGQVIRGRSMDLGDLGGEAVDPVLATFTYFGRQFRVNPDLTETTIIDLFEEAAKVPMPTDPRDLKPEDVIKNLEQSKGYVREHIHPDDFEDLWATARANRQSMQSVMELCWKILELISERPTSPPSGSSDGRPDIRQNSPDGASPRADDVPVEWWPEGVPFNPTAVKFVERFQEAGRPDKANIIMLAQEAKARAASASATG
jgi:hypothetical protein